MRNLLLFALLLGLASCSSSGPEVDTTDSSVSADSSAENKPSPKAERSTQSSGFHAESKGKKLEGRYARRLKLLYLEQSFRHEARWLNEVLKRDSGLDYQAYFFEADLEWTQPTSRHSSQSGRPIEPLRAPFWSGGKLISEAADFKALGYDVIVIGDIDCADSFWHETYWEWIEPWVKSGGGLIFVAGEKHNPSGWTNDVAKKLLPVLPDGGETKVGTTKSKYWGVTLDGFNHAVFRLSDAADRNRELLGEEHDGRFKRGQLDGLYWYAPNLKPKADAKVLARVVNEGEQVSQGAPLLVTWLYGDGRVLFLGSDDAHRWRAMVGDIYFARFWQNAIAWAARAEK